MRIIDKIFKDKKSNCVIYILLTVGILLLVGGKTPVHNNAAEAGAEMTQISDSLENQTEKILSEIEGVGKARVMIFCSETVNADAEGNVLGISEKQTGRKAQSVVVVADGADDAAVREKIVRAVKNALGVQSHKIEVFERKENQ